MADRNDSTPPDAESAPDTGPLDRNGSGDQDDRSSHDGGGRAEQVTVTVTRDPDERPAGSVVRGVASVTNTDPVAMDPLYDAVDPDALNAVFEPRPGRDRQASKTVSFRFNGCDVTVHGDGRTVVSPPE